MKTKMKYLVGMVALFLLTAMGVNAQVSVPVGSQKTYQVADHSTNGYTYSWSMIDNATTAAPVATKAAFTAVSTTNQTTIDWKAAGTYVLTLNETNSLGGCATPNTLTITVLAAAKLGFTSATSAGPCAGQDATALALTFTDANDAPVVAAQYPLVINYTIGGVAQAPLTIANSGAAHSIPLLAANRADQAAFNGSWDQTVVITSATAGGGTVTLTTATHTNTVYDVPNANGITQL